MVVQDSSKSSEPKSVPVQEYNKHKKNIHWWTIGTIEPRTRGANGEFINMKVQFNKDTPEREGFVMVEDLYSLIINGFIVHPTKGKEYYVRIKRPYSDAEISQMKAPLIKPKKDFFKRVTGF